MTWPRMVPSARSTARMTSKRLPAPPPSPSLLAAAEGSPEEREAEASLPARWSMSVGFGAATDWGRRLTGAAEVSACLPVCAWWPGRAAKDKTGETTVGGGRNWKKLGSESWDWSDAWGDGNEGNGLVGNAVGQRGPPPWGTEL